VGRRFEQDSILTLINGKVEVSNRIFFPKVFFTISIYPNLKHPQRLLGISRHSKTSSLLSSLLSYCMANVKNCNCLIVVENGPLKHLEYTVKDFL